VNLQCTRTVKPSSGKWTSVSTTTTSNRDGTGRYGTSVRLTNDSIGPDYAQGVLIVDRPGWYSLRAPHVEPRTVYVSGLVDFALVP
jgi:hypothetical protein